MVPKSLGNLPRTRTPKIWEPFAPSTAFVSERVPGHRTALVPPCSTRPPLGMNSRGETAAVGPSAPFPRRFPSVMLQPSAELAGPALSMLGVDSHKDLCFVLTSTEAPHVIRKVDHAWCQTWQLDEGEAVGKTLGVIAGPRSSNSHVGSRLSTAAGGVKTLSSWVDCGAVTNFTTRSSEEVRHHLVVGPVHDDAGDVVGLLGVSRILAPGEPAGAPPDAPRAQVALTDIQTQLGPAAEDAPAATAAPEDDVPAFLALAQRDHVASVLADAFQTLSAPPVRDAASAGVQRTFSPRLRRRRISWTESVDQLEEGEEAPARDASGTTSNTTPAPVPHAPKVRRRFDGIFACGAASCADQRYAAFVRASDTRSILGSRITQRSPLARSGDERAVALASARKTTVKEGATVGTCDAPRSRLRAAGFRASVANKQPTPPLAPQISRRFISDTISSSPGSWSPADEATSSDEEVADLSTSFFWAASSFGAQHCQ